MHRHQDAGADIVPVGQIFELVGIESMLGGVGDLDRPQPAMLQRGEHRKHRRRFDQYDIAGLGQNVDAQVQRMHAAGGEHDVVGGERDAVLDVAARDGFAQRRVALGRTRGVRALRSTDAPQNAAKMAVDVLGRKQIGTRIDRAELLNLAGAPRRKQPQRQFADRYFAGNRFRGRIGARVRSGATGGLLDVEPGPRLRDEHAGVLQKAVGVMHRRHAAAGNPAHLPDRRRLGAGRERAVVDELANEIDDPVGSLHSILPCRSDDFFRGIVPRMRLRSAVGARSIARWRTGASQFRLGRCSWPVLQRKSRRGGIDQRDQNLQVVLCKAPLQFNWRRSVLLRKHLC